MDKVEKKEGATMSCMTCGLNLVCRQFEFQGNPQLSWCDEGTTNKHYHVEGEKPVCMYSNIVKKLELLCQVEKFVEFKFGDKIDKDAKHKYVQLVFSKL